MAEGMRHRSQYHLTLGELMDELKNKNPLAVVKFDHNVESPWKAMSYRGYYSDLAFDTSDTPMTVAALLELCEDAYEKEFIGYKGGEFIVTGDTPLWVASYACTGRAIINIIDQDKHSLSGKEVFYLVTKYID